ncbi:MAG: hypothetical protein PHI01_06120, partial [Candidatus Izemoplasmatales bacterium]|nr:hypothetical protein [Candidatus Izemoplasmatales bacterium]
DNTFQTLITAYNRAKRNDETWGDFKNYGFYLMKEDLSSSESLTYANSKDVYAQPFVEGMIAAYQEYQLEANIDEAKLLYETYIETVYGRHLIEVTKGTAFAMPSAAFSMTYDDEENPEYSLGTINTSERLNLDQLKVFAEYRYYEMIFGADDELMEAMGVTMPLIPQKVKTALTTFFQDIYDAVYVIGTINTNMAQRLAGGAVVDSNAYYTDLDTEDIAAQLLQLKNIYFDQVFPDYIPS